MTPASSPALVALSPSWRQALGAQPEPSIASIACGGHLAAPRAPVLSLGEKLQEAIAASPVSHDPTRAWNGQAAAGRLAHSPAQRGCCPQPRAAETGAPAQSTEGRGQPLDERLSIPQRRLASARRPFPGLRAFTRSPGLPAHSVSGTEAHRSSREMLQPQKTSPRGPFQQETRGPF